MKGLAIGKRAKPHGSALDRAAQRWGHAMLLWGNKWVVRFIPKPKP